MKAIKAMGSIDEQGQLSLDQPLILDKNSRVEVIVLIQGVEDHESGDITKAEILEDFRQAWHEAMTGQIIPISQLWEGTEDV
jgi:hypothetical protein